MPAKYKVRMMERKEYDLAIQWAAQEGWNPGQRDAACYFEIEPRGFFIGEIGNQPVSMISAVKYGKDFGFIGHYIVSPQFRGQGYGMQIWNHAMQYLEGRNIGLDGVMQQQNNYEKSGFKFAYRHLRYGGLSKKIGSSKHSQIVELSDIPFDAIAGYDLKMFLFDRRAFLRCWINQPSGAAIGYLASNDALAGYGILRACQKGFKIGPLFADTYEIAKHLFNELSHRVNGAEIFYDPPELNVKAVKLAQEHHLTLVFETARMYTQTPPDFPLQYIFGSTTLEVG